MTNQQIESGYRSIPAPRLHDIDEKKHRVAVDFPITIDHYNTDFGPSAFDAGWREALPVMSVNHHPEARIGEAIGAESLHDRHRLVGEFDSTERGLRGFRDVRDGKFPGWSFEYCDGKAVPHPLVAGAQRLTSARMKEYGPVSRPAIPGTRVVGLRSIDTDADGEDLATLHALIERELRTPSLNHAAKVADLERRLGAASHAAYQKAIDACKRTTSMTNGYAAIAEARIGSIGDRLEDLRARGIVSPRNATVENARRSIRELDYKINQIKKGTARR